MSTDLRSINPVTGGARGLGITLAAALLEAGSHVYCLDILPEPSPKEWAALVVKAEALNLSVKYLTVDTTKPSLVNEVFERIAAEAPEPLRAVVAAAGSKCSFSSSPTSITDR